MVVLKKTLPLKKIWRKRNPNVQRGQLKKNEVNPQLSRNARKKKIPKLNPLPLKNRKNRQNWAMTLISSIWNLKSLNSNGTRWSRPCKVKQMNPGRTTNHMQRNLMTHQSQIMNLVNTTLRRTRKQRCTPVRSLKSRSTKRTRPSSLINLRSRTRNLATWAWQWKSRVMRPGTALK